VSGSEIAEETALSTTPPGLEDSYHDAVGPGGEVVLTPIASKDAAPRPWGFWATIGWTVLCLVSVVVVQNLVALAFVVSRMATGQKVDVMEVVGSGLILAVASLTSTPVGLGLIALLVKWRRWSLRDYLALKVPTTRQLVISIGLMVLLTAASDGLTYLLGWPVVPRFMVDTYKTAVSVPLFVTALVVGAPLLEESLFRGFAFKGIAASRAGPAWAIVLTALGWAAIHIQYDLFQMSLVLVGGLFLGAVRHRTGSTFLTMILHGVWNAIATTEVAIAVHRMGA
jgi:membrane protease YdiL (CAAX protease family)